MTLRKFAERLAAIVAENEQNGRADRNDLPVGIEILGKTPKTTKFYKHNAPYLSSCMFTVRGERFGTLLSFCQADELKTDKRV